MKHFAATGISNSATSEFGVNTPFLLSLARDRLATNIRDAMPLLVLRRHRRKFPVPVKTNASSEVPATRRSGTAPMLHISNVKFLPVSNLSVRAQESRQITSAHGPSPRRMARSSCSPPSLMKPGRRTSIRLWSSRNAGLQDTTDTGTVHVAVRRTIPAGTANAADCRPCHGRLASGHAVSPRRHPPEVPGRFILPGAGDGRAGVQQPRQYRQPARRRRRRLRGTSGWSAGANLLCRRCAQKHTVVDDAP